MQVVGGRSSKKRLVVVVDNSLIVEAITISLRKSSEFKLLAHVNARTGSIRSVVEAEPDVVLVDDLERSNQAIDLVRNIHAARDETTVIVLTMSMDSDWLDAVFAAGAVGVISKATHPAALATLVRETINGNVLHVDKGSAAWRGFRTAAVAAGKSPWTMRELEVLQLVADGSTNGEIARNLSVTEQTVKFHLSNLYRKVKVGNRTEAGRYAHVNGLVRIGQPSTMC